MAIDFPASPSLGETATYSNGSFVTWNGNSWRLITSSTITIQVNHLLYVL